MFQRITLLSNSFRFCIFISVTALAPFVSLCAQDAERGKAIYQKCAACHGSDGHGNQLLKAPQLAGLDAVYAETQLKNFKYSVRGADPRDHTGLLMRPMALLVKDEQDIKDVAAYIATLEPETPEVTLEGGDPVKGQAAYAVCIACHGANAEGNELLKAPSLQHQNDWYMLEQLKKFKVGLRGTNPKDIGGMQMRPMSMTLVDEQAMKDVIAHIREISSKQVPKS